MAANFFYYYICEIEFDLQSTNCKYSYNTMSIIKSEDGKKRKKKQKDVLALESFLLTPGMVQTSPLRAGSSTTTPVKYEDERNAMTSTTDLKNRWHLTGKLFGNGTANLEEPEPSGNNDFKISENNDVSTQNNVVTTENTDVTIQNDKGTVNEYGKAPVSKTTVTPPEEPIVDPGVYHRHTKLLYESKHDIVVGNDDMEEIFPGLEKEDERVYCRNATEWSLQQWITEGEALLNEQQEIFAKIIQKRVELSCNFAAVVSLLDDRAEALCKRGELIDTKLNKVKELGKEILSLL